ncbi:MAG: hypothetical protein ACX931_15010 [Saccharospirillum sp.]
MPSRRWRRAIALMLALLSLVVVTLAVIAWQATLPQQAVPRTIVPFSDLRRFQQLASALSPEQLRSGERLQLAFSDDDLQKMATVLANAYPATAQSQFDVTVAPSGIQVQVWWRTGLGDRYLPLQVGWHPDDPVALQSLQLGGYRVPGALLGLMNRRLRGGEAGEQWARLRQHYHPSIALAEQQLTLGLEYRPGLAGTVAP